MASLPCRERKSPAVRWELSSGNNGDAADTFAKARVILVAAYGPSHARVTRLHEMQTALYKEWGRPLPVELQ